jgi:hypothetical protein
MRCLSSLSAFAALALIEAGGQALAQPKLPNVPAVSWGSSETQTEIYTSQGYNQVTTPVVGPGTFTNSQSNAYASAQAQLTVNVLPYPSAAATIDATPNDASGTYSAVSAFVGLSLFYWLDIVGPAGPVSVTAYASGQANSELVPPGVSGIGGYSEAMAGITIYPQLPGSNMIEYVADSSAGLASGGWPLWFNIADTFITSANTPFEVEINVNASTVNSYVPISASASIDPFFTAPAGYTIVPSAGIGNSVPEASTWAMVLIGFAGLCFAGPRASRKRNFEINRGLRGATF